MNTPLVKSAAYWLNIYNDTTRPMIERMRAIKECYLHTETALAHYVGEDSNYKDAKEHFRIVNK